MLIRLMDLVVLVAELSQSRDASYHDLDKELTRRGYTTEEIEQAVFWYSSRGDDLGRDRIAPVDPRAVRVIGEFERISISSDCYGYLMRLLNLGIMDLEQFERAIARAIPVGPEKMELNDIKAIACSVVFNRDLGDVEEEFLDQFDDDALTT